MKNKFSNNQNIAIYLIILAAALSALLFFWHGLIISTTKEVAQDKKTLFTETSSSETISSMKKRVASLENVTFILNELYIENDNVVIAIEFLETMARSSGVSLEIQKVELINNYGQELNHEKGLEYNDIKMVFQARGSWSNVTSFILMVENLPYYMSIETLKLAHVKTSSGSEWLASFDIKGVTK